MRPTRFSFNPVQTKPYYLLLHAHYLAAGRSLEAGAPGGGVWLPAGASGAAEAQESRGFQIKVRVEIT